MSRSEFEYTILHGSDRIKATALDLPDELAAWVASNRDLVTRIHEALSTTYETLTEDTLWNVIAENSSEDWRQAKEDLKLVENEWDELNSPATVPLGLIGSALDSHIISPVAEKLSSSIANFNIINEGLKKRDDLTKLLQVFKVVTRILDSSAASSQKTKNAAHELNRLDISSAPAFREVTLKDLSNNHAKPKLNSMAALFRAYTQELLRRPATAKKSLPPKNKPAL